MRTLFFMFLFTAFLVIDGQSALSQGEDMRVPPIDMQQPEHVETATFALG